MKKKYWLGIGVIGLTASVAFSGLVSSSSDDVVVDKFANSSEKEIINHDFIQAQVLSYNFEEAVKEADLIVKLKVIDVAGKSEIEGGIPKTIFNTEILETYKSDNKAKDKIKILQEGTKDVDFNHQELFKAGEELILFLNQAVGEDFDNTYWSVGSYTTHYSVKNKEVIKKGGNEKSLEKIQTKSYKGKNVVAKQHFKEEVFVKKIKKEVEKLPKLNN
jgi:hypothetical protein